MVEESGGDDVLNKSFVKGMEVEIKDNTFDIESVGVDSETNGSEVAVVSLTSF